MNTPLAAVQGMHRRERREETQRTAAAGPTAAVSAVALLGAAQQARPVAFAQHGASADTGDSVHAAGSAVADSAGGRAQHAGFATSQPLNGQWFGSMWWKTAKVAPPATAADAVRIANSLTIVGLP